MGTPREGASGIFTLPGGRRIGYAMYGDPGGSPVLYCHGGLSSHGDIAFADEAAKKHGLRIVAADRPGIGDSDRLLHRDVAGWAEDVAVFSRGLGLDTFTVLGWSAGGPYALACGARLPSRVEKVATVGGMAPLEAPNTARQLGLPVDRLMFPTSRRSRSVASALMWSSEHMTKKVLYRQLMRSLSSQADRAIMGSLSPDESVADLVEALRHGPHGVVDDYATVGSPWGFEPEQVGVPVTMFHGSEDNLVPRAHAESLVARLPSARLEIVDHAGHFLLHDHFDHVAAALAA
jgi:pimeloyl-ACP methyl ester carboxylesterase